MATRRMRVLFVTPEVHPLIKVGGLADVSAALPPALVELGVDARLLMPAYPDVLDALRLRRVARNLPLLPGLPGADLKLGKMPDGKTRVYALDCPALYARPGSPYQDQNNHDWPDNAARFGALARAAAMMASAASPTPWTPDIVHCNDWPSGLVPAYLAFDPARRARTLMCIHNLAFPGAFPPSEIPRLGLPWEGFRIDGFEFHDMLSFLKAGLYYADGLATVSPTYAEEITTPSFGHGLHGLLAGRRWQLTGILNGIDTEYWNPATDPHLPVSYDEARLDLKAANKSALQSRLRLAPNPDIPLLGMVARLTAQKGADLIASAIHALAGRDFQVAILGRGARSIESELVQLAAQRPERVALKLGFDEALAHQIEGGADMFLMPSRYEPCGLNQMYSMRYGTPPIVRRTGGLADTVIDATPQAIGDGSATGFVFAEPTAEAFTRCVARALDMYADQNIWRHLQSNGMRRDFSWKQSASKYRAVYKELLDTV